ncbi:MAG: hypothetical protein EA394_00160 [Bacteroidia bacterium]|nr:MAG: hypothetical protein EA394_00160 [Bacteroidia bacterium]
MLPLKAPTPVATASGTICQERLIFVPLYSKLKNYLDDIFQMPDSMVALLMRFLEQNNGKLSKRACEKEFSMLTMEEVQDIERRYKDLFPFHGK